METESITVIGVVPTVARRLLPTMARRPDACRTLRTMVATGEVFPPELKRQLFAILPNLGLHSFDSSTEAGLVASLRPEEQAGWPDSMAHPVPGVEVLLVDENLADAADGEAGEILVRCGGPSEVTLCANIFATPPPPKPPSSTAGSAPATWPARRPMAIFISSTGSRI